MLVLTLRIWWFWVVVNTYLEKLSTAILIIFILSKKGKVVAAVLLLSKNRIYSGSGVEGKPLDCPSMLIAGGSHERQSHGIVTSRRRCYRRFGDEFSGASAAAGRRTGSEKWLEGCVNRTDHIASAIVG